MATLTGHAEDCNCSICSGVRFVLGDGFAEDNTIQCVPISDYNELQQRLATAEAERDRLKEAIKEFSDKWKYYDSKTITGLDDLRAALREVDGE